MSGNRRPSARILILLATLLGAAAVVLVLFQASARHDRSSLQGSSALGQADGSGPNALQTTAEQEASATRSGVPAQGSAESRVGAPEATSSERADLRGRAVDDFGRGLAGVRVELVNFVSGRVSNTGAEASTESSTGSGTQAGTEGGPARGYEQLVRRETTTEGDGAFVFESLPPEFEGSQVTAVLAGYVIDAAGPVVLRADRTWETLEIVLLVCGRVELTVLDASERPVPGLRVSVAPVLPDEPQRMSPVARQLGEAHPVASGVAWRTVTDAAGIALLSVPSGRKLEFELEAEDLTLELSHVRAGELVRDPGAEPVIVQAGELRQLGVRLGASLVVRGRVVFPDRSPVKGAYIRVYDGDPTAVGFNESRVDTHGDDEGRFELKLHDLGPETVLSICAADGWWWRSEGGGIDNAAFHRARAADAGDGVLELELVVAPLLTLSGHVLDADGAPLMGTIWAVPAGAEYLLQKQPLGLLPIAPVRESRGGAFEIGGLLQGPLDIVFKRGTPRTYHRFDGFQAGDSGIELRIEDDRSVEIHLTLEGGGDGVRFEPVLLKHHFRSRAGRTEVRAPRIVEVRSWVAERWPRWLPSFSVENAEGRTISVIGEPRTGSAHRFEMQQAGWYSVGALASERNGRPFVRRLSEPCWLDDGQFEFRMQLVPTTTLEGRALSPSGDDLFVEVLDPDGDRVRGPDGEHYRRTGADGGFRVEEVPVGTVTVRVGTWRQLESRSPRDVLRVDARRGEIARADFD